MRTKESSHKPVLENESVAMLQHVLASAVSKDAASSSFVAVDCTFGRGGHTSSFLKVLAASGRPFHLIALDRDLDAVSSEQAKQLKATYQNSFSLHHCNYSQLHLVLQSHDVKVDFLFADIGVSSPQLDVAGRGFGFGADTLDMRMDQSKGIDAATVLNTYSKEQLTKIFFEFGEEPKARVFARKILEQREKAAFSKPSQLTSIAQSIWGQHGKSRTNPATRVFQALRIEVNNELGELAALLENAPSFLRNTGVMGVISFHSLEDKCVKRKFKTLCGGKPMAEEHLFAQLPIADGRAVNSSQSGYELIKPFPQKPLDAELKTNPRSRSARLRWVKRAH